MDRNIQNTGLALADDLAADGKRYFTFAEARRRLGCSRASAGNLLNRMLAAGPVDRVRGSGRDDEAAQDARRFALAVAPPPDLLIVVPEVADAVRAFLAADTQCRIGPSGRYTGLDYQGAKAAAQGLGLKLACVFDGVRVMESEALRLQGEISK